MTLSTTDEATLDFYEREAPVYSSSGRDGVSRWLDRFMQLLSPGAHLLELGCGGGRDSAAMIAQGFMVRPDGAAAMAAEAQRRLGRRVSVMRFDELCDVGMYDAVWANASLLHVPLPALPSVLARVHRALKPGGLHFASYKAGGSEGRDSMGRYYNYPDRSALLRAYGGVDWHILSVVEYMGGGYEGGAGPWIALTARRSDT